MGPTHSLCCCVVMLVHAAAVHNVSSHVAALHALTVVQCCAELLSQLSNARSRAAAVRNVSAQLQQLELQLQSTRSASYVHRRYFKENI